MTSRRRKKRWDEEDSSENLPAVIPLDPERLPPETKETAARLKASVARAKVEAARQAKAARNIDRARAIEMGLVSPPWTKLSKPKPGSVAVWIDTLCPNGEWRLKTARQIERDIKKLDPEGPSYRAVARELRSRRR